LLTKSIKGTPLAEASAKFKRRQEQARDGLAAAAEYESAAVAMRDKTAKLRALRLAKEAEDAAEAAANPPEPVKKKKSKAKKKVG
jgi:hypothetical protein